VGNIKIMNLESLLDETKKDDGIPVIYPKPITRNDQIVARFKKFHHKNTDVWILFQHYTFEIIDAEFSHYSSSDILGRIRWHSNLKTKGTAVKINSCHSPYYSRLFMMKYPEHEGFFRTRKLTSETKAAFNDDDDVYIIEKDTTEAGIRASLVELLS